MKRKLILQVIDQDEGWFGFREIAAEIEIPEGMSLQRAAAHLAKTLQPELDKCNLPSDADHANIRQ